MKRLYLIMCCCCFFIGNTQNKTVDSLLSAFSNTKNDSTKVRLLLQLENNIRPFDPKKALLYANDALKIIKKLHWKKGFAAYYNDVGNNYHDQGKHSTALGYYLKSLDYSKDFPGLRAMALQNAGQVYHKENNFPMAVQYTNEAVQIALKNDLKETIADCLLTFALVEAAKKDTVTAKKYYFKSLESYQKLRIRPKEATILMHLGDLSKDYQSKKNYYLQSKKIWDSENPGYLMAVSNLMGLAEVNIALASDDKLRYGFDPKVNKKQLLAEAENYLNQAVLYSKQSNVQQNLMFAYGQLAEVKKMQLDFKSALQYTNLNFQIHESIFSQENKNRIAALESKQKIFEKDREIAVKKLQISHNETVKWYLFLGLGLLATIGLLLFYQNQHKKKLNRKLSKMNDELDQANKIKVRFFSILNHDLRSPVSNLIDFLHLQKDHPEVLDAISKKRIEDKTLASAENLLHSMEDILLWSKGQMEHFRPQPKKISIALLFEDMQQHFAAFDHISLSFENQENLQLITDEDYVKTILRNLTGNAIKALENVQNPKIFWHATTGNGKIILTITDNGNGVSSEKFNALYDDKEVGGIQSGLGLHLIRDLAKAINCSVELAYSNATGSCFILKFH